MTLYTTHHYNVSCQNHGTLLKYSIWPLPLPPPSRNGSTKNCTVIGGSTKNCTVIGQLIGEALGELGEAIGELAKPSAKASSTSSAAEAINITAQIDV